MDVWGRRDWVVSWQDRSCRGTEGSCRHQGAREPRRRTQGRRADTQLLPGRCPPRPRQATSISPAPRGRQTQKAAESLTQSPSGHRVAGVAPAPGDRASREGRACAGARSEVRPPGRPQTQRLSGTAHATAPSAEALRRVLPTVTQPKMQVLLELHAVEATSYQIILSSQRCS